MSRHATKTLPDDALPLSIRQPRCYAPQERFGGARIAWAGAPAMRSIVADVTAARRKSFRLGVALGILRRRSSFQIAGDRDHVVQARHGIILAVHRMRVESQLRPLGQLFENVDAPDLF